MANTAHALVQELELRAVLARELAPTPEGQVFVPWMHLPDDRRVELTLAGANLREIHDLCFGFGVESRDELGEHVAAQLSLAPAVPVDPFASHFSELGGEPVLFAAPQPSSDHGAVSTPVGNAEYRKAVQEAEIRLANAGGLDVLLVDPKGGGSVLFPAI